MNALVVWFRNAALRTKESRALARDGLSSAFHFELKLETPLRT
jgi:hypothetical protein